MPEPGPPASTLASQPCLRSLRLVLVDLREPALSVLMLYQQHLEVLPIQPVTVSPPSLRECPSTPRHPDRSFLNVRRNVTVSDPHLSHPGRSGSVTNEGRVLLPFYAVENLPTSKTQSDLIAFTLRRPRQGKCSFCSIYCAQHTRTKSPTTECGF